jgi:hypothetical protein
MAIVSGTVSDWYCVTPSNVVLTDRTLYFVIINITVSGVTVTIQGRFRAEQPTGQSTPT